MPSTLEILESQVATKPKPRTTLDLVREQTTPYHKDEGLSKGVSQGFKGESQYDAGLGYHVDQDYNRARNQPVIDQLANAAYKTIPGVALGIVENVGYLGELFSHDKDYNNLFTEIAREGRNKLEQANPVYRENSNQVFDLGDPAWWINHGQGLIESVGEFMVTGAGVGGGLSKGAKVLNQAIKGGALGAKVTQGAAQLGTASLLSYTEGAMSGAQVYKDVYNNAKLYQGLDEDKAVALASDAASKTVKLNTIINTGLNITSLSPIFKSFNKLDDAVRSGINRLPKESAKDYLKRLTVLEGQGIEKASPVRKLVQEAIQEGVEEDVNILAEKEGYEEGGVQKKRNGSLLDKFIDTSFTQEGALNFILGAVGGIAQTAGMEYAPTTTHINEQGQTERISPHNLEQKESQAYQRATISNFKKDIETLNQNQLELNEAVSKGDKEAVELAKNRLFNIGVLKSLKTETADALSQEVAHIATIDNTTIGEDGKTDATREGLADNIDDNSYKQIAAKKAADIRTLNKEYRDLLENTKNPLVATELFRKRLNVYAYESTIHDLSSTIANTESKIPSLVTNPQHLDIVKLETEIAAHKIAETNLRKQGLNKQADLVKSQSILAKGALESLEAVNGKQDISDLNGIAKQLLPLYTAKLQLTQGLNQAKQEYTQGFSNQTRIKQDIDKENKELTSKVEEKKAVEQTRQEDIKRASDLDEAKSKLEAERETRQENERLDRLIGRIHEAKNTEDLNIVLQEAGSDLDNPDVVSAIYDKNQDMSNLAPPIINESESTLGVAQLENIPTNDIKNNVILDQSTREELKTINEPKTQTYATHNKLAYKAQEQNELGKTDNPFIINDSYKILHSSSFGVGAELTLKIATETEFYQKNKDDINKIPIGVYKDNKLIGYLPVYRFGMNNQLALVRETIVKNKEVKDKIIYKGAGELNTGPKKLVSENYLIQPKFLIGKDGRFESGYNETYQGKLLNKLSESGVVYTLNNTPNGKEIATPADINKVDYHKVDSFINILDLYFKSGKDNKLSQEEKEFILTLQDRFSFDPSKPSDVKDYFNKVFHATNLNETTDEGKNKVASIREAKGDRYYVQVVPGGVKFMKQGDKTPTFYGKNDITNKEKTEVLKKALLETYARVDIASINSNGKFRLPVLKANLEVEEYSKTNYNEHVASITSTNIVSVKIGTNEITTLVQPNIYLGFEFLSMPEKKLDEVRLPDGEKAVNLTVLSKGKKSFKSITKVNKEDLKKQPTDDIALDQDFIERYKERCR